MHLRLRISILHTATEFIIDRSGAGNPAELREFLESIGDCVVVVDDEEIVKVHVHTNNPGLAIEKSAGIGLS